MTQLSDYKEDHVLFHTESHRDSCPWCEIQRLEVKADSFFNYSKRLETDIEKMAAEQDDPVRWSDKWVTSMRILHNKTEQSSDESN